MPLRFRWFRPVARLLSRALDLYGCDGDAITLFKDVVLRDGLPVDADEVVVGRVAGQLLVEELLDRRAIGNMDIISEPVELSADLAIRTRLQNRT